MIKTFADKRSKAVFEDGKAKRLPHDVCRRAQKKMYQLDLASSLEDLRFPPGNRLEDLKGDRQGQYSIRVNNQWRICFRWDNGNVFDVEMVDYHN